MCIPYRWRAYSSDSSSSVISGVLPRASWGTFAEGDEFHMAKSLLLAGGGIRRHHAFHGRDLVPLRGPHLASSPSSPPWCRIVLLLLQPAVYPFLGSGLIIMGVYCLDMLLMLVSTDIAFRGRIPVALSFGVAILATRAGARRFGGCGRISVRAVLDGPAAHRYLSGRGAAACHHRHAVLLPWPMCNGST